MFITDCISHEKSMDNFFKGVSVGQTDACNFDCVEWLYAVIPQNCVYGFQNRQNLRLARWEVNGHWTDGRILFQRCATASSKSAFRLRKRNKKSRNVAHAPTLLSLLFRFTCSSPSFSILSTRITTRCNHSRAKMLECRFALIYLRLILKWGRMKRPGWQ